MLSEHFGSLLGLGSMTGSDATMRNADSFTDVLNLLYRGGYLICIHWSVRQELTCDPFVRGQTDHELQKHDEDTVGPKIANSHRVAHSFL